MFVSAEGALLAQQPLLGLSSICWGVGVVMGRSSGPEFHDTNIGTYAVRPGPHLQLQHILAAGWEPWDPAPLTLSPDLKHVAFAVRIEQAGKTRLTRLAVLRVQAPHDSDQPYLWEPLGSQQVAAADLDVRGGNEFMLGTLCWQPGSGGIRYGSEGGAGMLRFV